MTFSSRLKFLTRLHFSGITDLTCRCFCCKDGIKQAEQLRDAVMLEHTRMKHAELEAEKWAGQYRQLQVQLREQTQAALQLKQDKQISQENANRYGVSTRVCIVSY